MYLLNNLNQHNATKFKFNDLTAITLFLCNDPSFHYLLTTIDFSFQFIPVTVKISDKVCDR